jgi:hypothetical protein
MCIITSHLPFSHAFSQQPHQELVRRPSIARPKTSQLETARVAVGTYVADDSLVIDCLPKERLHELPAAIGTFLIWAAGRGFCPPIPVLRSLGFRTKREIDTQRLANCWRW